MGQEGKRTESRSALIMQCCSALQAFTHEEEEVKEGGSMEAATTIHPSSPVRCIPGHWVLSLPDLQTSSSTPGPVNRPSVPVDPG
jgi:hypothetical protein